MAVTNKVIQSLWLGSKLGVMQQMCIKSYLAHGHEFHLYVYEDVEGIPKGTIVKNGSDILPASAIEGFKGPAQFYDFFAYMLLYKLGGWAVGLDTICLKPFDHETDYVFPTDNVPEYYISNAVMKAPANSGLMFSCYLAAGSINKDAAWAAIGPALLHEQVVLLGLKEFVVKGIQFDPVPWDRLPDMVDPNKCIDLSQSYAIHCRSSIWDGGPNSRPGSLCCDEFLNTRNKYDSRCLWEQLKRRYA